MAQPARLLPTETHDDHAPESGTFRLAPLSREDIMPYMGIVHQMACRLLRKLPPNVLRDDLVAAGTYGLMDALRKRKDKPGLEFEWYARVRIRGAMIDELRTQDWLSRARRQRMREQDGDRAEPRTCVIGFDDLPEDKRFMPPSDSRSPLDLAEQNSQRLAIAKAVAQLPAREASIIEMHYFRAIRFKDIAAQMRVSEPRISQLHARATGMLRDILVAAGEDPAA